MIDYEHEHEVNFNYFIILESALDLFNLMHAVSSFLANERRRRRRIMACDTQHGGVHNLEKKGTIL